MRLEYEGLQANKTLSQHERVSYAMERYAYYVCYKCKKVSPTPTEGTAVNTATKTATTKVFE